MTTEAKVTQAIRLRSRKAGEYLVAIDVARSDAQRGTKSSAGNKKRAARGPGAWPLELEELIASGDLEAADEYVLLIAGEDPETLEKMRSFLTLLENRFGELEEAEMGRLINAAMPTLSDRPPAATIEQARRNAETRARFLRKHEALEAEQVHALFGSKAKNKAALAARWRAEGKVFAVEHSGDLLYPAFQFDEGGRPRPIIGKVLAALGPHVGPWQVALWFVSPNGWLDGARPIELMDTEPDRVLEAARDVAEPVTH